MTQLDPILHALAATENAASSESKRKMADSKKNQTEALRACSNKDLGALEGLLKLGMSPNFLGEREGALRSPLHIAVSKQWTEGVDTLLEAGASDGGELLDQWDRADKASPALVMAGRGADALNFFKIFAKETDSRLRDRAIKEGVLKANICIALLNSHEASLIEPAIAKKAFEVFIHNGQSPLDAEACMVGLLSRFPACASDRIDQAWVKAIDQDLPLLCKALARAGHGPSSAQWSTKLDAHNFESHWKGAAPLLLLNAQKGYHPYRANDKAIEVGAIARAAFRGSVNILTSFLQVERLKTLFENDASGREALSYTRQPEGLKVLAEAGLDLSNVKNAQGQNPLHQACRFSYSKKSLEALCRTRPEWIEEKDENGKRPLELCPASEAAAAALIFDKIGIRDAVKGRKGKRTGEASKPRRL